jgi:opacity protein-like surface antigen
MDMMNTKAGKQYLISLSSALMGLLFIWPCSAFSAQNVSSLFSNMVYSGNYVIALGGGYAFGSDIGRSQYFPIENPDTDEFYYYAVNNNTKIKSLVDLFLGKEWMLSSPWALQVGVDFSQIRAFPVSGTLSQGIDTTSADQYSYSYSLLTRQLLAEGKLLYQLKDRYYPYFLLGLGAAFNKEYNYSAAVPSFTAFTRQYNNNAQTSFSYSVGFGIDATLIQNWRIGIGYRFSDIGKASLSPATINGVNVGGTLSQNHVYLSEVIAQLTWLI